MTIVNTAAARHPGLPAADTAVLADRHLNPKNRQPPSVFADDWWDISPGLFEAHIPNARMNFTAVPDRFRDGAKLYMWQLINHDDPNHRTTRGRRLALRSIALALPRLAAFLHWLDAHGIAHVADVTADHLDDYAAAVAALEATAAYRRCLLVEVRRTPAAAQSAQEAVSAVQGLLRGTLRVAVHPHRRRGVDRVKKTD